MANKKNRVVEVLNRLLSASNVPEGMGKTLEALCELYGMDRARSFVRIPNTQMYHGLHDVRDGRSCVFNDKSEDFNMDSNYYQKEREGSSKITDMLFEEVFIHTLEFDKISKEMEVICFSSTKGKKVSEAIVYCIAGSDESTGVLGYLVLERFEGNSYLTEQDLFEIESVFKVCNDRIENFERGKQLRDDELAKDIDEITGLHVFAKFRSEVEESIKSENQYAMVYLDIDKFKYINDMWSFETGTEILNSIAQVLKKTLNDGDKCCRIESDKFALLLKYNSDLDLETRINRIDKELVEMQQCKFSDIKITIIGGIYKIFDKLRFNAIVDKANIARKSTKGSYKNVYVYYNQNLENYSEREKELEKRMMIALENGEFVPFLQPKFDIKSNEISGAEALARWVASDRMISPGEFIPVFERNGFITQLDFIIYKQVFEFIRNSINQGKSVPRISLNVSRDHMNNANFLSELLKSMGEYEIKADMIELEITESVFVRDTQELQQFIDSARAEGLTVSIDDFGTAYSSLNLLKDVIVDVVKMDKSFIDNISADGSGGNTKKDKVIIKNIIQMINELEFTTVFEGLETKEQVEFMREIGCKYGQGYVFARPMPLDEFESLYL